MSMKKICGIGGVLLVGYLANFLGVFLTTPELNTQYSNCEYLSDELGLEGAEDSVFFSNDILIGSHVNLHRVFNIENPQDEAKKSGFYAVYGIETGNPAAKHIKVHGYPSHLLFLPHGIYLQGVDILRVINHSLSTGGERVETYKIRKQENGEIEMEYLHATIMEDSLNGITNDLIFLSNERFLITDWQVFATPIGGNPKQPIWAKVLSLLAWIIKLKTTNAWDCMYVENGLAKCVKLPGASGVMMNGIAFDGVETIAITDTIQREVKIFKLAKDHSIQLIQTVATESLPDNISYDFAQKRFILGGTNSPFEFLSLNKKMPIYSTNTSKKSIVPNQSIIETIQYNPQTQQYDRNTLWSSSLSIVGLAGGHVDPSQNYLFLNTFTDKSLVMCKRTK